MGEPSFKCCLLLLASALMTAGGILSVCAWFSRPLTDNILRVRQAGPLILLIGAVLLVTACCTPFGDFPKRGIAGRHCIGGIEGSVVSRTSSFGTEFNERHYIQNDSRWLNGTNYSESDDSSVELAAYGEEDFVPSHVNRHHSRHHRNGHIPDGRYGTGYLQVPGTTKGTRCQSNSSVDEIRSVSSTETKSLSSGNAIDRHQLVNHVQPTENGWIGGPCSVSNDVNAHKENNETIISIQAHPLLLSTLELPPTFQRSTHSCNGAYANGFQQTSQRKLTEYHEEFHPDLPYPPSYIYRYRDPNKRSTKWRPVIRRTRSVDSSDCWTTSESAVSPDIQPDVDDKPETETCFCALRSLPPGYSEA